MRYLLRVSYNGNHFSGFERLNNGQGVQNELERVLTEIFKEKMVVHGSGRTDAKVHAYDQCVHFDTHKEIDTGRILYRMNRLLSPYVYAKSIELVNNSFHARHSVKEKTYVYKIIQERNPIMEDYACYIPKKLNVSLMNAATKCFIGGHDFHNFVSGKREDYHSIIHEITITEDDTIEITFKGKSFYRYMVRSLAGALVDVGLGKCTIDDIKIALNEPNVEHRFTVLPAKGLYLTKIDY